jgi:hypothetical protein
VVYKDGKKTGINGSEAITTFLVQKYRDKVHSCPCKIYGVRRLLDALNSSPRVLRLWCGPFLVADNKYDG